MDTLNAPVLLLIFNRPEMSDISFEIIRKVKPKKLFIAGDGARKDVPGDTERCSKAREIAKKVDWPCEVKTLFQEENLGCGLGPVTAINWFFDNVESGIILEDDCLPDTSFFYFCQELLERYKDNQKIMHISGDNFQKGRKRGRTSYYFSQYTHSWGWATWARAWKYNDFEMVSPELRKHIWDKQWINSVKKQNGLAIVPNINLVSNIGIGDDATHTVVDTGYMNLSAKTVTFPLVHPYRVRRNIMADFYIYRKAFGDRRIRTLIFEKFLMITPKSVIPSIKNLTNIIKKIWR